MSGYVQTTNAQPPCSAARGKHPAHAHWPIGVNWIFDAWTSITKLSSVFSFTVKRMTATRW